MSPRLSRLSDLIRFAASERMSGRLVEDAELIRANPDLQPELERQLANLRLVSEALSLAHREAIVPAGSSSPQRIAQDAAGIESPPGYEILGEVHRGGQGAVLRARQVATGRIVALKVTHQTATAGEIERARVEREVRILAHLDSPNIVKVIDRGTVSGRNYFVMDFVVGLPLDRWIAALPPVERRSRSRVNSIVKLLIEVCEAVNAAHLLGIVHRDLKPANILVSDDGRPCILDFGLAKPTLDNSLQIGGAQDVTQAGQFVGSLPWASPEQARGGGSQIDPRSDVYSLGVLSYHALVGRMPYAASGGLRGMVESIVLHDPIRPRRANPRIDIDLEVILLKCLRKDSAARYASAGELASDLRRFVEQQPVEARRNSGFYRLRKALRRHWISATVASAFLLLSIGSAIGLGVLYRQAHTETQRAEAGARQFRNIVEFLQSDLLMSADPDGGLPRDYSVRQMLDDAAQRMARGEYTLMPRAEADIRHTIGVLYRKLGRTEEARKHLEREISLRREFAESGERDLADALNSLAVLQVSEGKSDEAIALFREAAEQLKTATGDDLLTLAQIRANWGTCLTSRGDFDAAANVLSAAISSAERGSGRPTRELSAAFGGFGNLEMMRGRFEDAADYLQRAVEIGRLVGDVRTFNQAALLRQLGVCLLELGDLDEARASLREAVTLFCDHHRERPDELAAAGYVLAKAEFQADDFESAEQTCCWVVSLCDDVFGADDARSAMAKKLQGRILRSGK